MKPGTIPFPREFHPGARGPDVRAVKRALRKAGQTGMADNTLFGQRAQECLAAFKHRHGLLQDPVYTRQAHEKLMPFFDLFGASLMSQEAATIARTRLRARFVEARRWMVAHHGTFDYAETRPIPETLAPFESEQRIRTDCSGSIELAARWTAGCPDPSRLGFNGEGNTATLMGGCRHIAPSEAAAGDLIVYRKGPDDSYGHHAVSVDEKLPDGDLRVVSHGHQGDPGYYLHSAMQAEQTRDFGAWQSVFLRFL